MERAGTAMASLALEHYAPRRTIVLSGGGNNGGDGFVIARELQRSGVEVAVLATKDGYEGDPAINLEALRNLDVRLIEAGDFDAELRAADLVVDALLGTGFSGEVREREAGLIEQVNVASAPVMAVDVPPAWTGRRQSTRGCRGRRPHGLRARGEGGVCDLPRPRTLGRGRRRRHRHPQEADVDPLLVWTDDGLAAGHITSAPPSPPTSTRPARCSSCRVPRDDRSPRDGRPRCAENGMRHSLPRHLRGSASNVDLALTEALVYGVAEDEEGFMGSGALEDILSHAGRATALVMGPGTGTGDEGRPLVEEILREVEVPVLLDADAITNLAGTDVIAGRDHPTVVTPHAGELGRLLGSGAKVVSAYRLESARKAAEQYGCCVLLKGSDTLVVEGEKVAVNSTGDVALATAGTGDVLSGVIGALLSRGMDLTRRQGGRLGARSRGGALVGADRLAGRPSMVASDLLKYLPPAVGELL